MDANPSRHGALATVLLHACILLLLLVSTSTGMRGQGGERKAVEGHVLHADSQTKLPGVLVMAWPCGLATATDAAGSFRVSCPHGIDSLTVSLVGFHTQLVVEPQGHVDVGLVELAVTLGQVRVSATRFAEPEARGVERIDLLQSLDATPGLQSLDLGAGMIQPVLRGLYGTRVAVLEDGVPQQGGRWGSDHGILVAPELQVAVAWVPGGGHAWMGPDAVGGGLRFQSPSRLNSPGIQTNIGTTVRVGNPRGACHVLHTHSTADRHWHAGLSLAGFGSSRVPQRQFSYVGRVYRLETGELPNTAGRSGHAVLGFERLTSAGRNVGWSMRLSDVNQGLFPGIIGLPRQGDLAPNDRPFAIRLPRQRASRVQSLLHWTSPGPGGTWACKASGSWNRREEMAPPHAHGWGPLPDSELSLSLEEWTAFGEARKTGAHGSWGVQGEGQWVTTSGWEFLLPSHERMRVSVVGESTLAQSTVSGRLDLVHATQMGHEEARYNATGEVVGTDVRAMPCDTLVPGGMLSWQRPLSWKHRSTAGMVTVVAYGRVPSNHEWGANGIHHGSFRFEQGNPNLGTEWAVEGRFRLNHDTQSPGFHWNIQGFAALHDGFISITPSARFAPISHAGQVYEFRANDAFRTGLEGGVGVAFSRHRIAFDGSVLGQWDLQTGLGLPFTTPAQGRLEWEGSTPSGWSINVGCRAIAPANLTARNESPTPGAFLADITLHQTTASGRWSLEVQNAFNREWLDHTSAYRALGLVAQGRWVQLGFTKTLNQSTLEHQSQ